MADGAVGGEVVEGGEGRVGVLLEGEVGVLNTGCGVVFAVRGRGLVRGNDGRAGSVLGANSCLRGFNPLRLLLVLLEEVCDSFFMQAFGFGEIGGLRLEGFDAGS